MSSNVTDINEARSAASFAARYISLGWWVLPLDPGTKKPLGRLVRNGFHDATNDTQTATNWWRQYPDAGVGVALKASGLVAIDIDPRNGGIDTIDQLEAIHGPIVSDVLALTGGGGEHRLFAAQLVEGLPGTLGPGVDLKADGYIAVEPTLHPSGKRYGWESESDPLNGIVPSTLPTWIRDLGRSHSKATAIAPPAPPIDPARAGSAQEALQHINSHNRETWVAVGAAIHNEMPNQAGFSLWDTWSQTSSKYDPQDQMRVWRSFKRKGLSGLGLNSVFAMAQKEGWKNTGAPVVPILPPSELVLTVQQLHAKAASVRWAVKHIIPERGLGFIYGASGAFKSFIALDYALHRAYGLKWLGKRTKQATPVYLAAEGGSGLMRRIEAWHQQRHLDWQGCPMRVVIVPLTLRTQAKHLREAIDAAGVKPGDLVIDTMSQTFTGNENSNDEVAEFLRVLGLELRDALGCTVTVVHHSGHSATERPRGASAIVSNVDFALGVFRDEKEMLATVEFAKIKDAERPPAQTFNLTVQELGRDEDGDSITSLVASHINNAEELLAAVASEAKAGRGGNANLLLGLVHNGIEEKKLRRMFYEELGDRPIDTKKKMFYRARDWAVQAGLIEVAQGIVITLKAFES